MFRDYEMVNGLIKYCEITSKYTLSSVQSPMCCGTNVNFHYLRLNGSWFFGLTLQWQIQDSPRGVEGYLVGDTPYAAAFRKICKK